MVVLTVIKAEVRAYLHCAFTSRYRRTRRVPEESWNAKQFRCSLWHPRLKNLPSRPIRRVRITPISVLSDISERMPMNSSLTRPSLTNAGRVLFSQLDFLFLFTPNILPSYSFYSPCNTITLASACITKTRDLHRCPPRPYIRIRELQKLPSRTC